MLDILLVSVTAVYHPYKVSPPVGRLKFEGFCNLTNSVRITVLISSRQAKKNLQKIFCRQVISDVTFDVIMVIYSFIKPFKAI